MKKDIVHIIHILGLQARPAVSLVNNSAKYKSECNLLYKGREANMKSIMDIMSLKIPTQSDVTISCSGEDEEEAIAAIEEVLRAQKIIA
ncbi:MAG: HPr family phosphocarrier protein [Faecalicoccus sp.]|uniref:HPr family phosphocarrier protein n=1 Tax=unclassified Faecalicoccus TaxID=2643311 RepID=UPI0025E04C2E|nr:HPr family phosphocarrier protein [Faecalicoccus sp.]MCI6380797.1 HPr family phosphocarrier protein [Erysipelotrichaceae bacterium]MDY4279269.1 HPr family phosphocarrier protein [Faecalicoccus sp.]MDY4869936.1 HPr family phosphocarrier protein [Faecalicoccus sp.]MDY5111198.1 HPr family phosphocarrier protein [Faecalicoccus sp.]